MRLEPGFYALTESLELGEAACREAGLELPFRQVRMAMRFERREHKGMYTPMLDFIANRVREPAATSMDHRWGRRSTVQVRIHAATWRTPRRARLRNISVSGALLELEPSLPPMKPIDVEIALCTQDRIDLVRVAACVVRKADCGVGVEWREPLPFAVDQLLAGATDVVAESSESSKSLTGYTSCAQFVASSSP